MAKRASVVRQIERSWASQSRRPSAAEVEKWIAEGTQKRTPAHWPAGFFDKLATADAELVSAVTDMSKAITVGRKSKKPMKR